MDKSITKGTCFPSPFPFFVISPAHGNAARPFAGWLVFALFVARFRSVSAASELLVDRLRHGTCVYVTTVPSGAVCEFEQNLKKKLEHKTDLLFGGPSTFGLVWFTAPHKGALSLIKGRFYLVAGAGSVTDTSSSGLVVI